MAAVAAAPQYLINPAGLSPLAYSGSLTAANTVLLGASPLAYSAISAPVAALPAPLPVAAVAPGPIAYQTGARVINQYQPVEQHGYTIVY